jgi:putative MATE family efflux protein
MSEATPVKRARGDMTQGNIVAALALFALPILLTNFFQQFYVTVDSMILGQYSGKEALAAASNCGFLISALVCFFNGVSVGAGVVLAQLFGAHDEGRFGRAVWSAGALALVAGLLLTAVCFVIARPCLALMNLEGEVLEQAVVYMQVYALSTLPALVYNMGAAVFRAYGDSTTPMAVLVVTSVVNVALAFCFVAALDMGVFGAALATVLAQLASALATLVCIARRRERCCIAGTRPVVDAVLVRRMLGIGIPNGIQYMVICLSSVIISSQINLYGIDAMDGFGAYSKVDGWIYMPAGAVQSAIITFVGQNVGAGEFGRARTGVVVGTLLNVCVVEAIVGALWLVRVPVFALFSTDPDVIAAAEQAMAAIVPLYALYAIYMSVCGLYYGVGSTLVPMALALAIMCLFRIAWVFAAQAVYPSPVSIYLSYPVTWLLMVVAMFTYYFRGRWNYRAQIAGAPRR